MRNAEPGTPGQKGCAGSGVFINATDKLIVAQNLIGRCDNSGIFAIIRPDRRDSGTAIGNNVSNNIFAQCGKSAIVFLNPSNEADGNFYVSMPTDFQGLYTGDSKQYMDLAAWREHGWDKNSGRGRRADRLRRQHAATHDCKQQAIPQGERGECHRQRLLRQASRQCARTGPVSRSRLRAEFET